MAEKRSLMPKLLIALVVLVAVGYAIVRLDVWYAEKRAAEDLPEPPGTPSVEGQP